MNKHEKNSLLFYFFLVFFVLLSVGATYLNIIVEKNFKQFSAEEEEPSALDFYIYNPNI
jgi:hypothetical protein